MRRRLVVLGVALLLVIGVAVAVWAGSGSGSGKAETCRKTITVQDTESPRMMEYHRTSCDEDFAVGDG